MIKVKLNLGHGKNIGGMRIKAGINQLTDKEYELMVVKCHGKLPPELELVDCIANNVIDNIHEGLTESIDPKSHDGKFNFEGDKPEESKGGSKGTTEDSQKDTEGQKSPEALLEDGEDTPEEPEEVFDAPDMTDEAFETIKQNGLTEAQVNEIEGSGKDGKIKVSDVRDYLKTIED